MKNIIITKPQAGEYPKDFQHYFDLVPSNDLLAYFDSQTESVETLASSLDENELLFRYAPGKWSVKGVLAHVIDCERVYCYRALSFARGEKEPLPGFDENAYEVEAKADARNISDIIEEYETTRAATVSLFQSFDEEMLLRIGMASGAPRSVRALGYLAAGHELHHLGVIRERYLSKL